ncbi:MAG: alpha/beta fold hydrolase [Bacillus sp. (in: Bacteria)]|nr:alpha/beta fold hydrolase [Bacillus sp. (in: firmicutes)]
MLQGRKSILCISLIGIILVFISCSSEEGENSIEMIGEEVVELLVTEKYEEIHEQFFSEELKASLPATEFRLEWRERVADAGEYEEMYAARTFERGEYHVYEQEVVYTYLSIQVRMIYNNHKEIISLHFDQGAANHPFPEGIVEETVIIGKGGAYELNGTLTLPEYREEDSIPAVVLVHGSGPHDQDSAVFGYKPFRDIAWGLAKRGIAVLRYDKRTYVYGNTLTEAELRTFSVQEETIEDAILAGNLLKEHKRIDSEQVYLLGHSLGGMLAPRIDATGGDFAGLVIMAGSPRSLWEIIYDQNLQILNTEEISSTEKEELRSMLEKERNKALHLQELSKEEAIGETLFTLPAYYFKEMELVDMKGLVKEMEKPILVLQGEDDFQVSFERDFLMWKELLGENASFISYSGLNHFFVDSVGGDIGSLVDYETPGIVSEEVIADVAQWIMDQYKN